LALIRTTSKILKKKQAIHTTLLGAGILVVEHLCSSSLLPENGFTFSAIPPKFKSVGISPARALAKRNKDV